MQDGEKGPLFPQPANKRSGSLGLCRVQLWEKVLGDTTHYNNIFMVSLSGNVLRIAF